MACSSAAAEELAGAQHACVFFLFPSLCINSSVFPPSGLPFLHLRVSVFHDFCPLRPLTQTCRRCSLSLELSPGVPCLPRCTDLLCPWDIALKLTALTQGTALPLAGFVQPHHVPGPIPTFATHSHHHLLIHGLFALLHVPCKACKTGTIMALSSVAPLCYPAPSHQLIFTQCRSPLWQGRGFSTLSSSTTPIWVFLSQPFLVLPAFPRVKV